jgi:hypothetical protein
MPARMTPEAVDTYLVGLSWLDAFDSDDLLQLSLLHGVCTDRELLLGVTAVASMLRREIATETPCDPPAVTAQLRDDLLQWAAGQT